MYVFSYPVIYMIPSLVGLFRHMNNKPNPASSNCTMHKYQPNISINLRQITLQEITHNGRTTNTQTQPPKHRTHSSDPNKTKYVSISAKQYLIRFINQQSEIQVQRIHLSYVTIVCIQ